MRINPIKNSTSFRSINTYNLSTKQDILFEEAQKDPVIAIITDGFEKLNVDFDFEGETGYNAERNGYVTAKISNPTTDDKNPLGKMRAKLNCLDDVKQFIAKTYAKALTYMLDHDETANEPVEYDIYHRVGGF